jgi:hypothetical protein
MPTNLLVNYNNLLEIDHLKQESKEKSLRGVFKRDFVDPKRIIFYGKQVFPVPSEGKLAIEQLFWHLTTKDFDGNSAREFDSKRAKRLHWVRHHIDIRSPRNIEVFSVLEGKGIRTYIYDKKEKYIIVLEPYRNKNDYYLLTAYPLEGKSFYSFENKLKRKLPEVE